MILENVGMLMAKTMRSSAYLQALLKKDLKPSYILLLEDTEEGLSPGQIPQDKLKELRAVYNANEYFDLSVSVAELIEKNELQFEICKTKDVNDHMVIEKLNSRKEKYFIYSGFGSVILGKNILSCGKKFLHAHPGSLPAYRGSTTTYYHILNDDKCFVSVFFLDEEIDTGPLIKVKEYPKPNEGMIIDYVYDPYIRANLMSEALEDYTHTGKFNFIKRNNEMAETYFIIHPVLKHIAILSCKNNNSNEKK